ncbi:Inner centromere protein-related protein [Salix suchowensis]|nr:Inner centromere protein-related protein [Salix suchowensis]
MGPQVTLGVATPGLPGGKRTSWLKKAREVKAMEETIPTSLTRTQAQKRRGGNWRTGDRDPESRKPKAPKSTLGDFNLSVPDAVQSAEEAPTNDAGHYAPSTDVEKTSEQDEVGIFNTFKKTMQGLGAQIGRSGKSLAGASLALAEARAAAEAKIAEREKQTNAAVHNDVEDKTTPLSIEQLTGNAAAKSHESERRSRGGRLSVSELVVDKNTEWSKDAVFNAKVFHRVESGNPVTSSLGSVSTTPPHSPPASTSDFAPPPPGPVFNKPVPVFVPPAPHDPIPQAKAASGLSSKVTQPTFSLPAPMSLGLGSFRPLRVTPITTPFQLNRRWKAWLRTASSARKTNQRGCLPPKIPSI